MSYFFVCVEPSLRLFFEKGETAMKNLSKKIMALMLCTVMMFSSGVYGVKASGSDMDAYAAGIIGDMLMINGYENLNDITISNGIAITDIENPTQTDKKMYFALDNSEIIGTLIVECIKDEYYSSFTLGAKEEIYEAYSENEAFALFNQASCLIMRTSTDNKIIENNNFVELDADSLNYPTVSLTRVREENTHICSSIDNLDIIGTANVLSASSGAYTVTDIYVPFVHNAIGPNGKGICWAASIASILNYRIGTNYTAISLYNRLWAVINGSNPSDPPVGNARWTGLAFAINNVEYTDHSALSGAQISNILSSDRPIYMGLSGVDNSGESHGHAVVLEGIYVGAANFYLIVDSNEYNPNSATGNVITVSVTDNVLINGASFVYTTDSITYNGWVRTVY